MSRSDPDFYPDFDSVPDDAMSRSEKLALGFGLGIPAVMVLVSLTYWYGIRDTWEVDSYSEIIARCETVLQATNESDDEMVVEAYEGLIAFIGDRTVESDFLADKLKTVEKAIAPVLDRREQARREREAEELAERKRREAVAEAQRRREQAREAAAAASRREGTYKGFSESELQRLYGRLRQKGYSSEEAILTVKSMLDYPDTRAVAREWLRKN